MIGMIVTAGVCAWGILELFAFSLCSVAGDADRRMKLETAAGHQQTSCALEPDRTP